jgi:hypothetical protein
MWFSRLNCVLGATFTQKIYMPLPHFIRTEDKADDGSLDSASPKSCLQSLFIGNTLNNPRLCTTSTILHVPSRGYCTLSVQNRHSSETLVARPSFQRPRSSLTFRLCIRCEIWNVLFFSGVNTHLLYEYRENAVYGMFRDPASLKITG